MGAPFKRTLSSLLLLSLTLTVESEKNIPEFPQVLQLGIEFYQTEVQVTNEDQQTAAYATEYYDSTGGPRGRVDTIVYGNKRSVFYSNETDQIIEVTLSKCEVWDTEDSLYDDEAIFYGWLLKKPLVIGPTAPWWRADADRENVKYVDGEFIVRDIKCNKFYYNYIGDRDNVTFYFYFAKDGWTTPYKIEDFKVPIRIEVRGQSSKESEKKEDMVQVNQLTDFVYFKPVVKSFSIFQPPEGIGCNLKKVTKTMPKMPKKYKYTAEVVDLTKVTSILDTVDIEYQQVWYDSVEKLARYDKYSKARYLSELYDFNAGVTYRQIDGRTCEIKSLRNSFFEGYDGQMIGHLKQPGEVLGLDDADKFYYLGKKIIRGIWCDVFESVTNNYFGPLNFMGQSLSKLVITVYYSNEFYEVAVDGETENRVPVFYAVKGWDTDKKVVINLQYNIFAFDDAIYPAMYASFRLSRCFPSLKDKSYFILVFSVSDTLAAKMESQDDYIMEQLRGRITQYAKISNIRIPVLRADYKTTGVYVTGLMLDRPPALKQFWLEFEGDRSTNDPNLKVVPYANTNEKCAYACVDQGFECFGFFMCNEACFLKFKDILEPDDGKVNYGFGETCQEWLRGEKNSKNEPYLSDAMKSLEEAVLNALVNVTVEVGPRQTTIAPAADIVIGDGPYTGTGDQEKPYSLVISFAKLDPDDETTEQISYIDNLHDCYRECKTSEDISCSSFSYCPDSSNKQCSISSVLVVDRKNNPDDTVDDKNCYVYSMKYLDYYEAYPGRVNIIPGADVFNDIKTAEECAQKCRQAKKFNCRGFDFCPRVKSCVLHTKHILDLKPGSADKKSTCTHYAAKYAADYYDMGHLLIDDNSDVRNELSLEECAKVCSEELKDKCKSFNYCPKSGPYMTDSSCALSTYTHTSNDPKITTTKKPPCHHFEKKEHIDDWGRTSKKSMVTSGYTKSGFTWLVIGMLVLGLTLGAVGFVVYSYFRSKSSGDGMSVRFMKQGNI